MNTYRDIVYMVLDQLKLSHDDSFVQEEHVLFLLSKLRAYLLKNKYGTAKQSIGENNYQTIKITFSPNNTSICADGYSLISNEVLPNILLIQNIEHMLKVLNSDWNPINFVYVNNVRFNYVLSNKWLRDFIYFTIDDLGRLLVRGASSELSELQFIYLSGVFEDIEAASALEYTTGTSPCDILDREFPIEESLIIPLLELCLKFLSSMTYSPSDTSNNANDDLSSLDLFLRTYLKRNKLKYNESADG